MMKLSDIRILFFSAAVVLVMFNSSCSKVTTIGKKSHKFGKKAKQIIWIQIAGLTDEHLGLVKFNRPIENANTPLENSLCAGKIWGYNLFNLRVEPESGFISQMTGSKNIKNQCSDYDRKFIWNHLEPFEFQTAILEGPANGSQSILKLTNCEQGVEKLNGITVWLMQKLDKTSKASTFHYQKSESLKPGIFMDRSCQSKGCYTSLTNNARAIWERLKENPGQRLLIIRDFSYYEALKKRKNILLAREKLNEIMDLYKYFRKNTMNNNTLILLSSSTAQPFEYPNSGKQWNSFLKKGRNVLYKRTSLLSSVWADGPGAENFCSYMDESDLLERILWAPEKGVLGSFEF